MYGGARIPSGALGGQSVDLMSRVGRVRHRAGYEGISSSTGEEGRFWSVILAVWETLKVWLGYCSFGWGLDERSVG
jgi:hypothetical protein